jgi:Domain of unknown function (DUF6429)
MPSDLTKLEQLTLVLLRETACHEGPDLRCWKGYDWQVMNRLHEMGFISDPVRKAKSVYLTDAGRAHAEALASQYLGGEARSPAGSMCECGLCGEPSPGGGFKPGHDQKLRTHLEARVGGLLALRELVDVAEAYSHGQSTTEELTRQLRALLAGGGSRPTRS